jgi:hypothetical protein
MSTTTTISSATRILTAGIATTLVAETVAMGTGRTIRNIAAARLIVTEPQQTGSAVRQVETHCPIVKLALGNRLDDKEAVLPAIARAMVPSATGQEAELGRGTGPPMGGRTALETGIFRVAGPEIATPSEGVQKDSTERAQKQVAAAALLAWEAEAVAAAVAVVGVVGSSANSA